MGFVEEAGALGFGTRSSPFCARSLVKRMTLRLGGFRLRVWGLVV